MARKAKHEIAGVQLATCENSDVREKITHPGALRHPSGGWDSKQRAGDVVRRAACDLWITFGKL